MAQAQPQNFGNHARLVPAFHFVAFPILAVNLLYSLYRAATGFSWDTLLAALNKLSPPKGQEGDSLRLPIQDVYKISGIGAVPVGRVETGTLKPGMKVSFRPSAHQGGKVGEVKSVEMHHAEVPQAVPGDNVGFNLRGVSHTDIRRGDICGPENDPPTVARAFKAQVMILDHPNVITKGYTPGIPQPHRTGGVHLRHPAGEDGSPHRRGDRGKIPTT